jgi:hypothetical protein
LFDTRTVKNANVKTVKINSIRNKYLENRVLRRVNGPWREKVTMLKKMYEEQLHNFCGSPDVISVMK